jgi:hypothetical protein
MQAAASRNATQPEVSVVGQINEQVRRVSIEMAKRISSDKAGEGKAVKFTPSHGLTSAEADTLLQQWGKNELVEKVVPTWLIIFRLVSSIFRNQFLTLCCENDNYCLCS